jgi:hypothetical protein
MTLEMASAVKNHVTDGLNGTSSTSFRALQDEINLTTSAIIVKLSAQGYDINKTQRIDGIRIECKDCLQLCMQ